MSINVLTNLLEYAEILERKNEYIKADMITDFVKQAISAEEIDWSQPNAYMTYMDAMKRKEDEQEQTISQENSKSNKKNSILSRLQKGAYNDILITDLAKLAHSFGFEVTTNGQHFKFTDKSGKLRQSPNEKYKSGTILIGGHKKNQQGVADYLGTKDFVGALRFLGYL